MDSPGISARSASIGNNNARLNRSSSQDSASESSQTQTYAGTAQGGESRLSLLDSSSRQNHSMHQQQAPAQSAPATAGPHVDPQAQGVNSEAQGIFVEAAQDHDDFHALMRNTFGPNYDYATAEKLRQQTLAGDFSWMPNVEVVSQSDLTDQSGQQTSGTALGAYSAETDTIYISAELLANDPERALEIMLEEIGHALDVRLNDTDSAGDEGDIFAQLIMGNELSQEELDALRAENDSGTIIIDGQEIEVEYGCNPVKAVVDVFKAPFEAVVSIAERAFDGLGAMWEGLKDVVIKVLNSPIFNAILMVAQFIPIPFIQLAVRIVQIVKAVYSIAQGIKHGSISMVLSGVASLASGAANLGGIVGASKSFIDTATKVAEWAGRLSKIYAAASAEDFATALSLAGEAFGVDSRIGTALGHASTAYGVYEAVDEGDVLGALELGSSLIGDLNGGETPQLLETLTEHAGNFSAIVEAVESGNYEDAANLLMENYGGTIGLSEAQQDRVGEIAGAIEMADGARAMIEDGNYAGAALALFAAADQFGVNDTARAHLETAAEKVSQLAEIAMLIDRGEYSEAIALGAKVLDSNPSEEMQNRVNALVNSVDKLERAVAAVESGDYSEAIALGAQILDSNPSEEMQARVTALVARVESLERAAEAAENGDYTQALGHLSQAAGMPLSDSMMHTLANIEARVEAAQALHKAVENDDIQGALTALEQLTGVELPEKLAPTLAGIENAVERVEELKDAVDNGQYAIAASIAANLADQAGAVDIASGLRSLSALLQQLGFRAPAAPATAAHVAA